jgi:hypothetical protein
MAKKSSVNKNNHRRQLVARYAGKRKRLKDVASCRATPPRRACATAAS